MTPPRVLATQRIPPLTAGARVWMEALLGPLALFPNRYDLAVVLFALAATVEQPSPFGAWLDLLRVVLEHGAYGPGRSAWLQIDAAQRIERAAVTCDALGEPLNGLLSSAIASIVLLWRGRSQLAAMSEEELSEGIVDLGTGSREESAHIPEVQEALLRFVTLTREHEQRRHLPDPDRGDT